MSVKHSKFLALVLRHKPEAGDLKLDAEGWAPVTDVMRALRAHVGPITRAELDQIVEGKDNEKKRYSYDEHKMRIRAAQGHSLKNVDLGMQPVPPPDVLYHGTKRQFLGSILKEGLKPGKRQHVHLSPDIRTATIVAARRGGESVILRVKCSELGSHPFYQSDNGVWLTDSVPATALEIMPSPSEDEILDATDAWHEGNSGMELHEYLGWSFQEMGDFVRTNKIPNRPLAL